VWVCGCVGVYCDCVSTHLRAATGLINELKARQMYRRGRRKYTEEKAKEAEEGGLDDEKGDEKMLRRRATFCLCPVFVKFLVFCFLLTFSNAHIHYIIYRQAQPRPDPFRDLLVLSSIFYLQINVSSSSIDATVLLLVLPLLLFFFPAIAPQHDAVAKQGTPSVASMTGSSSNDAGGACPKHIRQLLSWKSGVIVTSTFNDSLKKVCVGTLHR